MMLLTMAQRDRVQDRLDRIKTAALSDTFNTERLDKVYPDLFKPDPFAKAEREDGTYDPDLVDDEAIEWSLPRDPGQDAEISAWIAQREQGSVSADAVGERI